MTIAINARLMIRSRLDGIGWFTYENVKRLIEKHPEANFHLFFDRPTDFEFLQANVSVHILGPKTRHPFALIWWQEVAVKNCLELVKPDVYLSCDGFLSLRSSVPALAVIHDINFVHYPKDLPWYYRIMYNHFFPRYARKARRIATVSEFSKKDLVEQFSCSADKIDVVYNGVNEGFKPLHISQVESTRVSLSEGSPYFIFVGSIHPRKNMSRLLSAFDRAKSQLPQHKLLVVGDVFYWTSEMKANLERMQHKADVIFTGRLDQERLFHAVAAAEAMLYIPYFEGFGIPILEAFASDVPLITSNVTSMPEVAGDAALLVDPFDVEAIATSMIKMATNGQLRNGYIEKGRIRLKAFSWDKTADLLWKSIEKTTV